MKTNYEEFKKRTILNAENQMQWSMKKLIEADFETDEDRLDSLDFLAEATAHIKELWKIDED